MCVWTDLLLELVALSMFTKAKGSGGDTNIACSMSLSVKPFVGTPSVQGRVHTWEHRWSQRDRKKSVLSMRTLATACFAHFMLGACVSVTRLRSPPAR
jgi:hypothetical protein